MTFTQSIKATLTTNYAKFSGRASRSEFWWFMLFSFVLETALFLIVNFTTGVPLLFESAISQNRVVGIIVACVAYAAINLALILPLLGLIARRLHDRNLSGWWTLPILILNCIVGLKIMAVIGGFMNPNITGALDFGFILYPALLAIVFIRKIKQRNLILGLVIIGFVLSRALNFAPIFPPFSDTAYITLLTIFFMQKGAQGPNRYGRDPLRPHAIANVFA